MLGGVIVKDFSASNKWYELRRNIGLKEELDEVFMEFFKTLEHSDLCTNGDIDSFLPVFAEKFGLNFSKQYSMLLDFVDRFEKNPSIWPVLRHIKRKYHIGLLTNMYPRMFRAIQDKGLFPPIEWDVIIDSSVVGLRKPDKAIFDLAEKIAQVKKEEILFVDNSEKNIEAASHFGWQTFLYDSKSLEKSSKELMKKFRQLCTVR